MSLFTFWCGVAVVGVFGLGHLIGSEIEARERWAEWERARRERARRETRGRS